MFWTLVAAIMGQLNPATIMEAFVILYGTLSHYVIITDH